MKELFEQGRALSSELSELCGIVQNSGMTYAYEDIDTFDDRIKSLIKELGVWKTGVIMYCQENMESETADE